MVVGGILESVCAFSARIMATASFQFNLVLDAEVKLMINAIVLMCLVVGTTLLGRSG
jgi:hypothetical protein